jgi:hypothetical protein
MLGLSEDWGGREGGLSVSAKLLSSVSQSVSLLQWVGRVAPGRG